MLGFLQVAATRSTGTGSTTNGVAVIQDPLKEESFDPKASKLGPISEVELESDNERFSQAAAYGQKLLQAGDVNGYLKHLEQNIVPMGKISAAVVKGKIVRMRV